MRKAQEKFNDSSNQLQSSATQSSSSYLQSSSSAHRAAAVKRGADDTSSMEDTAEGQNANKKPKRDRK
jgi:type IV secretory pathway TrbL component